MITGNLRDLMKKQAEKFPHHSLSSDVFQVQRNIMLLNQSHQTIQVSRIINMIDIMIDIDDPCIRILLHALTWAIRTRRVGVMQACG